MGMDVDGVGRVVAAAVVVAVAIVHGGGAGWQAACGS